LQGLKLSPVILASEWLNILTKRRKPSTIIKRIRVSVKYLTPLLNCLFDFKRKMKRIEVIIKNKGRMNEYFEKKE
jgi:hypothetical protein